MDPLLNYDAGRTTPYNETILIPSSGSYRLKYIPKDGSVLISGFSLHVKTGLTTNQYFIDYAPESYYFQATGVIFFSSNDAGRTVTISYVPVASRIDANDLNPALAWYESNKNSFPLISDLREPNSKKVVIDYTNIINGPALATDKADGLLSFLDKQKIDTIDKTKKPIGSVVASKMEYSPDVWGGPLIIENTESISAAFTKTGLAFTVDPKMKGLVSDPLLNALSGTYGNPDINNRYVTENDPRIKNPSLPNHNHEIAQVNGLQAILDNKSNIGHHHALADIDTLVDELAKRSMVGHHHEMTDVNGLNDALTLMNQSFVNQLHTMDVKVGGVNAALLTHHHSPADIDDLNTYIQNVVAGNPEQKNQIDPYTQLAEVANMSGIVNDFNVSGLVSSVASGKLSITAGMQYSGGILVSLPATSIPTAQHDGGVRAASNVSTEQLHVEGYADASLGARTFTVTVTTANKNPGMHMDLALSIVDSLGAMSFNSTFARTDYSPYDEKLFMNLGQGLKFMLPCGPTTQFAVGDKWTITIGTSNPCNVYVCGNNGNIAINPNPSDPYYTKLSQICTVTGGSTVADKRPNPPSILKSFLTAADVANANDSSGKLANTKFVQAAITNAIASSAVITKLQSDLTALTARVATLELK